MNPRAIGAWIPAEVIDRAFRVLGRDREVRNLDQFVSQLQQVD